MIAFAQEACEHAQLVHSAHPFPFPTRTGQSRFSHGPNDQVVANGENFVRDCFQQIRARHRRTRRQHIGSSRSRRQRALHFPGRRCGKGRVQRQSTGSSYGVEHRLCSFRNAAVQSSHAIFLQNPSPAQGKFRSCSSARDCGRRLAMRTFRNSKSTGFNPLVADGSEHAL